MANSTSPPIVIRCLGTFDVSIGLVAKPVLPTDKVRALLAYLALEARPVAATGAGRSHRREALAGMFWPEHAESNALANLRLTLHRLRQALEHAAVGASAILMITRQTVQLQQIAVEVDAVRFQALLAESAAHSHQDLSRCEQCLVSLAQAADLYHGELLAGFGLADAPAFEEWLMLRREVFHQQALMTLHILATTYEQRRDDHQAHLYASRQLALDPSRESAHRQLMRILARRGQLAEAIAQYQICCRLLQEELGAEPDSETLALYEQIRSGADTNWLPQQDHQPSAAAASASLARPPSRLASAAADRTRGEIPETAQIFGRRQELAQLERWLAHDRCRLITLVGMGGVGKTTLAAAAAREVAAQFDVVIWRSLLNAPPLDDLLRSILSRVSSQSLVGLPSGQDALIALLLDCLSERRCLLVLDNLESILQPDQPGYMRPGYAGYAQLIQIAAERGHQSCLLLTSRERPRGAERPDESFAPVRTLVLDGLDTTTAQPLLASCGLASTQAQAAALIERYSGNPLALNLVAQTVKDLFGGDIAAFLSIQAPIFDDIRAVLDQQFARLSSVERELLIWLAIEREPVTVQMLAEDMADPGSPWALLEAVRALQRRSLVGQSAQGLVLQNVITEYLTDYLVDQVCQEIAGVSAGQSFGNTALGGAASVLAAPAGGLPISALNRHALIKATAKEYVRSSQVRLIAQPIIARLTARLGKGALVEQLDRIIAALRATAVPPPGYAAGNILNLLLQLGVDLQGYDFSRLNVRHAYLQGALLAGVNFRKANFAHAVFTHTFGDILAVHFDPDGQLCVAGLLGGKLCLWRAADEQLLQEYQISGAGASIAAFSPDGRVLASADTDHQIRLWDVARGQLLHTLSGHPETPWTVMFNWDGTMLASSGRDGTLHLWDVAAGRMRQTFQGHATSIHALAFSPDRQTLASGDVDGTVCVWRIGMPAPLHKLQGHQGEVHAVVFDLTGRLLASGGDDRIVRVWQVADTSGALQIIHTLPAHTQMIRRLAISADGHTLASGGLDTFVCLWDVRSGQARQTLQGHAYPIHHLAFPADGRSLATVGTDQTICLWDVATGQRLDCLQVYSNQIYSVAFSPDGRSLASGGADSILRLWHAHDPVSPVELYQGHSGSIYTVAFGRGGAMLASGGRDGTIRLWDTRSHSTIGTLYGHTNDVEAIQFSPDGQQLASASSDQTVRLWDVGSGRIAQVLYGHTDRVRSVVFSPDGRLLASSSLDRTVRVWDARSGEAVHTLHGHTNGVKWVAFSHDGQFLASSSYDRTMRLWDAAKGQLLFAWPAQNAAILSMAFHPDGTLLATGATDNSVRLWDVPTGRPHATLRGHTNLIESVCFSPDGRWLASGSADETIKLWDVATGSCLRTLRAEGPYAGMNIAGVTGISPAQQAALKTLGAVELEP